MYPLYQYAPQEPPIVPRRRPAPPAGGVAGRGGGVHRPAGEERDLEGMGGIGEIAHVDAALIPPLDEEVAPRHRDEPAVVRHAVLLRSLRAGDLEAGVLGD